MLSQVASRNRGKKYEKTLFSLIFQHNITAAKKYLYEYNTIRYDDDDGNWGMRKKIFPFDETTEERQKTLIENENSM